MKKMLMIFAGLFMAGLLSAQESRYEILLDVNKGYIVDVSGDVEAYGKYKEFIDSKFIPKDKGEFRVVVEERMKRDTLNAYFVSLYKGTGKNPKLLAKYAKGVAKGVKKSDNVRSGKVDKEAMFRGQGPSAFSYWVSGKLRYPKEYSDQYVQGPVYTNFTVNEKGLVDDILILMGNYPLFDREAFRVISKSPKWTPAQKDGKPVDVLFSFPVYFHLEN